MINVVLISTYELGRQPFGLASPAAWLKEAGASVTCLDLAIERLGEASIASADLVAFYLPMHTATRIAIPIIKRVKQIKADVHLCCYGLYASVNESLLRKLGVQTILGGEFEAGLVDLAKNLSINRNGASGPQETIISLAKQKFLVPDRSGLPELQHYAHLDLGAEGRRTVGYTEASRGCKHLCRHCPIVPVYGGQFRIVQREIVLEDIRRQVAAGADHITFGDPDFFNGPGHAIPIVKALHQEWPDLTYDVTIKIEHLLAHAQYLPLLRDSGCLFVTSAVESIDDHVLQIFAKGHTRADFIQVISLFREAGLTLNPTFVTFTPWISLAEYLALLTLLFEQDLVDNVAPIQYAIRLLIPAGSRLLELPSVQEFVGAFDEMALCYPWSHPDPRVDQLQLDILDLIQASQANHGTRREIFRQVWELAHRFYKTSRSDPLRPLAFRHGVSPKPVPRLSEPWYC